MKVFDMMPITKYARKKINSSGKTTNGIQKDKLTIHSNQKYRSSERITYKNEKEEIIIDSSQKYRSSERITYKNEKDKSTSDQNKKDAISEEISFIKQKDRPATNQNQNDKSSEVITYKTEKDEPTIISSQKDRNSEGINNLIEKDKPSNCQTQKYKNSGRITYIYQKGKKKIDSIQKNIKSEKFFSIQKNKSSEGIAYLSQMDKVITVSNKKYRSSERIIYIKQKDKSTIEQDKRDQKDICSRGTNNIIQKDKPIIYLKQKDRNSEKINFLIQKDKPIIYSIQKDRSSERITCITEKEKPTYGQIQKYKSSEGIISITQKDKPSINSTQKDKSSEEITYISQENKSTIEQIQKNKSSEGIIKITQKDKFNIHQIQKDKSSEIFTYKTQIDKISEGAINTTQKDKSLNNKLLKYPEKYKTEILKKEEKNENIVLFEYIKNKLKYIKTGYYQKYFSYLEYLKYSKKKITPILKKFLRITNLESTSLIEFVVDKIVSTFSNITNYIDKNKTGFYRDANFNEFIYGIIDPCLYENLFSIINEDSMNFNYYKKGCYINKKYQTLKGFINEKAVISYLRLNYNDIHEYPRISIGLNKYYLQANGYLNFNSYKYNHKRDYYELDYVFSVQNIKDLSSIILKAEYKYEYNKIDSSFSCVKINKNISEIINEESIYFCELKSSFPKDNKDIENIVFNLVESISYFKELYLSEKIINCNKKYVGLFIYDTFPIIGYQEIICKKLNNLYSAIKNELILYSIFFSSKIYNNNFETLAQKVKNLEGELNNTKVKIDLLENKVEFLMKLFPHKTNDN